MTYNVPPETAAALAAQPRVRLAHLPTPIQPWPRLSDALGGPKLWVKRDDLTGLATGGNKTRKLEFLVADALEAGADSLITAGGPQSNHCRQTAAAAAQLGLDAHLVLGGDPPPPENIQGNLFLDQLLRATTHFVDKTQRNAKMESLADELRAAGRSPYVIPVGGSNAVGTLGYVAAMFELAEQLNAMPDVRFDRIVMATSSGGTQAGLTLGAKLIGFRGPVTAISIDQEPEDADTFTFRDHVRDTANACAELLGSDVKISRSSGGDLPINHDYLGGGYGVVGPPEIEAINLLATLEGQFVGPVYTSRALAGLIDLIRNGQVDRNETILFWHTGGDAALHAYRTDLSR
ncbi:MAG: D-cysteine desulfhydrase family protein [Planctomycetota bacterium]